MQICGPDVKRHLTAVTRGCISTDVRARIAWALAVVCACAPECLYAFQCPDGTPPPCVARVAVARVVPPAAAERARRFLILPFRNISRAAEHEWLIEGATTMLGDALARWREIRVVPDEQLYPALRRATVVPGTVPDPAQIRRIAEWTGGWTAVSGDVIVIGGRLRIRARAVDVVTGRELARDAQEVRTEDVRTAFDHIATALLRAAGLEGASTDLATATTSSLDAYRAYLRGAAYFNRAQFRRARDAFLESARLDSNFAKPYYGLALATVFISPLAPVFEPRSTAQRYAARAVQLGAQLPARDRDVAAALGAALDGRFAAARQTLERLTAADSNDISALSVFSLFEWLDPILVPAGSGERPRGSLNRSTRLARRLIELNPGLHSAFIPLVASNLLASGDLPGMVVGVRREAGSLQATFLQQGTRLFVPMLLDTFALVPVESLSTVPAESLAAARRRALEAARVWSERWLVVGPDEAEAHATLARVLERQGRYEDALRELAIADSIGVEAGLTVVGARRLAVLGKLGRYAAAARIASDLWATGLFAEPVPLPVDQTEALAWAFNLFLMHGDFARADSAWLRMSAALWPLMPDTSLAAAAALTLLSGSPFRPIWQLELPPAFRTSVMDSLWARRAALAPESRLARALPTLARLASAAAASDSALAARVRAAPWYRP